MAASSPARRPGPPFPSRSGLLSGRLAAGRHPSSAAASSLPAPQRLASPFTAPGQCRGAAGWMFWGFYWHLHQDEDHGGASGLPELAFQTGREQGVQGHLVSPHGCLCVWLSSASLACFEPHLVRGVCGLSVAEVAGPPFPHSCSDTHGAPCLQAAGGTQRAQAPPGLRGDALKTPIKPTPNSLHLGNQACRRWGDGPAGPPLLPTPLGSRIGKGHVG